MNLKTLLALVYGIVVLPTSTVEAAPVQPPIQARVNVPLLTGIFHKRDQQVLNVMKDMSLASEDGVATKFADVFASVVPKAGISVEDFDFDLHVDSEYLGAESDKLAFEGKGTYDGAAFTFSGPVSLFKLQYALGDKWNVEMNFNSKVFQEKAWNFDVSPTTLKVTGATLTEEAKAELLKMLTEKMDGLKVECLAGKEEIVPEFPMDAVVPFVGLYYGVQFAEAAGFDKDFVSLGGSLKHLELLTEKQNGLLKAIDGGFYNEQNKKGDAAIFQVLVDDNFFNSLSSVFVSIDKMFSYRELAKGNPKMKPSLKMLTTSTLGTVLPQFVEEYGADKRIDVAFSPSHELFKEGFPGSKMTGMYMDKNGNWKLQVNVAATINVEMMPEVWDSVRQVYVTLVFKYKQTTDDTNPFNKQFVFTPKNIEISQLKVMKGDEEMSMEQMMIQSMANIQFEQLKKQFQPYPMSVGDIVRKNPKEMQCFGFNVSDLDIAFKKSQVQLTAYYKNIDKPDKSICDAFEEEIRKSPGKILDQIKAGPDSALGSNIAKMKEQLKPADAGASSSKPDAVADKKEDKKVVHDEL